jgi:hypothetical protein
MSPGRVRDEQVAILYDKRSRLLQCMPFQMEQTTTMYVILDRTDCSRVEYFDKSELFQCTSFYEKQSQCTQI